jgi:branched-chain amino acid aminotransferase
VTYTRPGAEIDWDSLGFGLTPTDYMYVMRCSTEEDAGFSRGELSRYGNIDLSPASGVLNYGQVHTTVVVYTSSPPIINHR